MKNLILFCLPLLFCLPVNTTKEQPPKKSFYFCISGPTDMYTQTKKYILYTDVKEITCEDSCLATKLNDWTKLVTKQCQNPSNCTSDLFSYDTFEQAKAELGNYFEIYADTASYAVTKVNW